MNLINYHLDENGIGTLTLHRPELHNAFNEEMIAEIKACLNKEAVNNSLKVLLIRGEGASFCAGADLNWMKSMKDFSFDENKADAKKLFELFEILNAFPKTTLGYAHGAVMGGGNGLIACCDHVIAAADTVFGFTEARLGLIPGVISPFVIKKIGSSWARSLFLSGTKFNAETALKINLIHEIAPKDHEGDLIQKTLSSFLKASPEASCEGKKLIAANNNLESKKLKEYTIDAIARMRVHPHGQEGMDALLNKRAPNWDTK